MALHYRVRMGYIGQSTDPNPTPQGWADAFVTRDIDGIINSWYRANTGHDPDLSYLTTAAGTFTVNLAWLQANEGNGRVWFADGRWHVERYRTLGTLRIAHDGITFNNMFVDAQGSLYGVQSRDADGNAHGIIIQNSTICGNWFDTASAALNFPAARDPDQIIFRNCDFSGFRAGIYCFGGITAEYNYSHDLHYTPESHNTGASVRAGNVTLHRNLIIDGNSSCISMYPEYGPYDNVHITENILKLPEYDLVGPEVLMAADRAFTPLLPGQVRRLVGNLLYRGGNRGEGGGFGGYIPQGLSEVSGNFDRFGLPVAGGG